MNNEARKVLTLLLSMFIIASAFIPALSPFPKVNDSPPEYSLFESFTNRLDSSNSSPIVERLRQFGNDFMRNYATDYYYLILLDKILYGALGIILIMLFIGVLITITSKVNSGSFIRFTAILNTLVYLALILLTYYQANKLYDDTYGISSYFIRITPSPGAWVGLIASFALIFTSGFNCSKAETASAQNNQNVIYPAQNLPPKNPPTTNIQEQPHLKTGSHIQTPPASVYSMSDRPEDNLNQKEIEIARLGNGYESTASVKSATKSTGVTLTDKRLYLSGKLFKIDQDQKFKRITSTQVFDLQDIVGLEFRKKKGNGLLIAAIILFILNLLILFAFLNDAGEIPLPLNLLLLIISICLIFLNNRNKGATVFVISSKTVSVGFDVSFAGQETVKKFAENIQTVLKAKGIAVEVH